MNLSSLTPHKNYGSTLLRWTVLVLAATNVIYATTMLWIQSKPRRTTSALKASSASAPISTDLRNFSESDIYLLFLPLGAALNEWIAFVGRDYPREWSIGPLEQVHMPQEDTVHYALDTPAGSAEWDTMLPGGGDGVLYLGPQHRPFSISLFHQLRCLNILRLAMVADLQRSNEGLPKTDGHSELVRHCAGYLRQMILCRSELRLENVRIPRARSVTNSDVTHTCKNWQSVYSAAERNRREHAAQAQSNASMVS
jgi:hypothetical protein